MPTKVGIKTVGMEMIFIVLSRCRDGRPVCDRIENSDRTGTGPDWDHFDRNRTGPDYKPEKVNRIGRIFTGFLNFNNQQVTNINLHGSFNFEI